MEIIVKEQTGLKEVLDAARITIWKGEAEKQPSETFIRKIYRSEHSPIRERWFTVTIEGIPSWIATHFVRHHVGSTPYVATQRNDRTDKKRDAEALVNMRMTLNAQSLIDMSRRRLCKMSHRDTVAVMKCIREEIVMIDPALAMCMVPQCVYRGFCPEGHQDSCYKTQMQWRKDYVDYQLNV